LRKLLNMNLRALFLIDPESHHNDNHLRLPDIFSRHGWQVDCVAHEDLHWQRQKVYCGAKPAAHYNLIWPVGLGPRRSFLDRISLLRLVDQHKLINHADVYVNLHGKTAWLDDAPTTVIATDLQSLTRGFNKSPGPWVLKPLAGSFGHQVSKVSDVHEITKIVNSTPKQYWMLQKYVPEIVDGETRTLVCGATVIGSYLRVPDNQLHANLAAHATASVTSLNPTVAELVARVQQQLIHSGVGYAAIDTVGGYLMEVNVANPGGLGTLSGLYNQEAIEQRLMSAISQRS
jgi:glutathione synthase/RimK-type ligase-like ATP-grasp enzyme